MPDPRFDTSKDPRFKHAPKNVRKVQVDKRFAHMFTDKQFVETPTVDSSGRRVKKDSSRNKLKEFYALAEDVKWEEPAPSPAPASRVRAKASTKKRGKRKGVSDEGDDDDEDDEDDADAKEDEAVAEDRGAVADEDDELDDEMDDEEDVEEEEAEVDGEAWENDESSIPRGDATKRVAIMGCDWDLVSAADLLVMLHTYLGSKESAKCSGTVDKVTIYPSDYGIEQLEKESKQGPQGFGEVTPSDPTQHEDEEDGKLSISQVESLRKYQLQRTKYYYAIVECDNRKTGSWIYDQLDGMEASTICPGSMDFRFVPDDLEFPHTPKDSCTEIPKKYEAPAAMQKSSLGHTKVKCTWDENPAKRKKDLMTKRFSANELRDADYDAYLASTDEEEGDDSGAEALKSLARELTGGSDDDGDERPPEDFDVASGSDDDGDDGAMGDMEASFNTDAFKLEEDLAEKVKQTGKDGRRIHTIEKKAEEKDKSVWDKYLDKRKEKRREKKQQAKTERVAKKKAGEAGAEGGDGADEDKSEADENELKLLTMEVDGDRGFNVRGKKRDKGGKQKEIKNEGGEFAVNVNDPRISGVFSSADFEIDPTNPEYRASEGMKAVLKKKRKAPRGSSSGVPAAASFAGVNVAGSATSAEARGAGSNDGSGMQLFKRKRTDESVGGNNSRAAAPAAKENLNGSKSKSGSGAKKAKKWAKAAKMLG